MTTKTIPAQTFVVCDACGLVCGDDGARRRLDARVTLFQNALDVMGHPVGADVLDKDLCDRCACAVEKALAEVFASLRAKAKP